MIKTYKFLETESIDTEYKLRGLIRLFSNCDDVMGQFTQVDWTITQILWELINDTRIYDDDGEPIKYSLERVEFLYCILLDAKREVERLGVERFEIPKSVIRKGELCKTLLLGDDNMHFEVLEVSDEEFNKDMDSFHMIDVEIVKEESFEAKCRFESGKEICEEIERLFGDLKVFREAKEFIERYESRKERNEELYYSLLINEILYSDEIISDSLKIVQHVVEDYCCTERGTQHLTHVIGYDIIY